MFLRDSRRQRRLEDFTQRSEVIARNPPAEFQHIGPQERFAIQDFFDGMDLDLLGSALRQPNDETFDFAITKRNDNTAADGNRPGCFINEAARERQADGDFRIHETYERSRNSSARICFMSSQTSRFFSGERSKYAGWNVAITRIPSIS